MQPTARSRKLAGVVRRFALSRFLQDLQRRHPHTEESSAAHLALPAMRTFNLRGLHILRVAHSWPLSHQVPLAFNDIRVSLRAHQRRRYVRDVHNYVGQIDGFVVVLSHLSVHIHQPLHLRRAFTVHLGDYGFLRHNQEILHRRLPSERSAKIYGRDKRHRLLKRGVS